MIPKQLFMAWAGSEPPDWATRSFREYQDSLGSSWHCEFLTEFSIPKGHILEPWLNRLPYAVYKADVFRLWLLETYGGIWVDTDTRLVADLSPLLIHESFATCHRTSYRTPLDGFHVDSCIWGQSKQGPLSEAVITRVLAGSEPLNKFKFGFRTYLTGEGKCPAGVSIGPYDEQATKPETFDFIKGRFKPLVPKRNNSFVRHYLTNLYNNKI